MLSGKKKNLPANSGDEGLIPGSGRSSGGRNGKPLQYSYLENCMDRGTWQAIVHEAAKSQTQLGNGAHTHILGNNSHALYSQSSSKMFTGTKLRVLRWGKSHGQGWDMAWRKKRDWEKQARPSIKFQCKNQCRLWLGMEPVAKNVIHAGHVGDRIYRRMQYQEYICLIESTWSFQATVSRSKCCLPFRNVSFYTRVIPIIYPMAK